MDGNKNSEMNKRSIQSSTHPVFHDNCLTGEAQMTRSKKKTIKILIK